MSSKTINLIIKTGIGILLGGLLYLEMRNHTDWHSVWPLLKKQFLEGYWAWMTVAVLLVPLNWLAETQKWHPYIKRYEPIKFGRAFLAVLSGVSFSLFTPNRVGEYGGRILYVKPQNRWKAVIVNLVGTFSQHLVLLSVGLLGALYCIPQQVRIDEFYLRALAFIAGIGLVTLFLVFFNIHLAIPLARRLPLVRYIKPYVRDVRVLEQFSRRELWHILRWSIIRYTIYSTQYFALLMFFDVKVSIISGYAAIATIFLVQTTLPLPPAASLLARGNLALHIWGNYGAGTVQALAVTFTLWIINLILPAVIGTFSFFFVNITKQLGYEDA